MKYILGFFHTIYLQLACWLGWHVKGKRFYVLWTVRLFNSGAVFDTCHFDWIGKKDGYVFSCGPEQNINIFDKYDDTDN